jgi:murein L,D-transpeptidase YafK
MLKKLTLLFLLSVASLSAIDILSEYRAHGIKNIEQKMDLALAKKSYWKKYLKSQDTTFGYLEKYSNVLTCNKEKSTLNLYVKDKNKKFKLKNKNSAFTGKNSGDKKREGDAKTPIGVYELVAKKSKETKLDPFYGPYAFVTSYPNSYDTYRGKNGHGIWIHGVPESQDRDAYTKGCIAIQNINLKKLEKNIDIKNTLLIIDDNWIQTKISIDKLATIISQLFAWRYAWIYSDIDKYLSFYSNDFIRFDGMKIDTFKRYKRRIFSKNEKKTILFKDLNVVPYPNTKNTYQVTFKEFYQASSFKFEGEKSLMVKLNASGKMQIFTEK